MSAYKNVGGEKAYVGRIAHGLADLIFCDTYKEPKEIFDKVRKSRLAYRNIVVELIYAGREWDKDLKRHMSTMYGAKIVGVPSGDALNLPDWEE